MQLTSFTDYALRVLLLLGLTEDRLVTVEELAERYGVSRHHITKVVHRLGALGYVQTVRGKNGGVRLGRDAAKIRIGDIVRDFEGNMNLVECFDARTNTCPIQPGCALQGVLRSATGQFLAELDRHTLADLLGPRRRLRSLLDLPDAPRRARGKR